MGLFDKIKSAFAGTPAAEEHEFTQVLIASVAEAKAGNRWLYEVNVNKLAVYQEAVLPWDDAKKIDFLLHCIEETHRYYRRAYEKRTELDNHLSTVREAYLSHVFRTKFVLAENDIARFTEAFLKYEKWQGSGPAQWPLNHFLAKIEKQYAGNLSPVIINDLTRLKKKLIDTDSGTERERAKLCERIDALCFGSTGSAGEVKPTYFLGADDFTPYANAAIDALPATERTSWFLLLQKAQKASGSKPTKKYLDETIVTIKELGTDKFRHTVNDWFVFLYGLKEKITEHHGWTSGEYLSSVNIDAMKGFIWMCAHFHDARTIHALANLAERSYRKIPNRGPAAAAMGNACLYTLYKSKGLDGVGQLSRLKLRIKQSSTQALIDKYLLEAAKEQGVSLHEIEDLSVDDYGLEDGVRTWKLDDYTAELRIVAAGKSELAWFKPDGTPQKTVPAFVKEKYADKLKKIKAVQKQVDQGTSGQRDRVDRMFRPDRKLTMEHFDRYFFRHGLMQCLTRRLIWKFAHDGTEQALFPLDGQWVDVDGNAVEPHAASTVSLWHPATETVETIRRWREFMMARSIRQPVKQAYREVYLLTDAEARTKNYSNRMAAHVLKQHQFNVLAKTRGWKFSLLGAFDNGISNDLAELKLPEYNLRAEYWVNEVNADDAWTDSGIWMYIATDQVRFVNMETGETADLVDVPAIPFSEVLRDVDLFVGVASVGNDPTWQDSGGIPAYRDYWTSYSFGDLSEVAKNRKELLTNLLPRLKIAKVAEIRDKFLVVKGSLRTYKIHIGSTNILMEPNDQYLCIVPDRSQKNPAENLFIPFEGDSGLSIVLSKAFLLADDHKITDTSITSQINRN